VPYVLPDGGVDPRFAQLMVALAEVLGARLTEARVRSYAKLLEDVPYGELKDAFRRAASERTSTIFPSPGELRAYLRAPAEDAALLAWSALARAAEKAGAYASLECEDHAAAEAVLQVFGSWPRYCEMEDGPALALARQEFLVAYRQARRTARRHEGRATLLFGLCQHGPQAGAVARLRLTGEVEVAGGARKALPAGGAHGVPAGVPEGGGTDKEAGEGTAREGGEEGEG